MELHYRTDPPLNTSGVLGLFAIFFCFLACGSFFITPTPVVSVEEMCVRAFAVWTLASMCFWALPVWYYNLATGYHPTLWLDTRSVRVGVVLATLPGVVIHFTLYAILRMALSNVQNTTERTGEIAKPSETVPMQQQETPSPLQLAEDRASFVKMLSETERARSQPELERQEQEARKLLTMAIQSYRGALLIPHRRGRSVKRKQRFQHELLIRAQELEEARRKHIACLAALDAYSDSPLSPLSGRSSEIFDLLAKHPSVHRLQTPDKTLSASVLWIDLKTIYIRYRDGLYEIGDFRLSCDLRAGLFVVECLRKTSTGPHNHPFPYGSAPGICFGDVALQDLKTFLSRLDLPAFVDTAVKMMTQPSNLTAQYWRKV